MSFERLCDMAFWFFVACATLNLIRELIWIQKDYKKSMRDIELRRSEEGGE